MAPQFLSAGVIISEVQGNSGQIPIPSTSTFAMAGYSPRGPEGRAFTHGSLKEFFDRFGGFNKKSVIPHAAAAFFLNGGSQLAFVRALHSDATYASGAFTGTWDVRASGRGVWAEDAKIIISGNESFYNLATASYSAFDVEIQLVDPTTGLLTTSELFEAVDLVDDESSSYIANVIENDSEDVVFTANTGGVPPELLPVSATGLTVGTGDGVTTAFPVSFAGQIPIAITTFKLYNNGVEIAVDNGEGAIVLSNSFSGTISGTIDYETGDVNVVITPAPALSDALTADLITAPAASVDITLAGGSDGTNVIAADVVAASLAETQEGIYAFDTLPIQMSMALPDFVGDVGTDSTLLGYASTRGDILVILAAPQGASSRSAVNYKRNTLASTSSFGAMYWPWVKVPDPLNNNRPKLMPPHGHVAGRYAFTDNSENVGKAPAGVNRGQLSFISGLEREVTQNDRDTVYQAQINPIRSDATVGTAIWGNKTLQVVGDYTDVNVRRSFIFLEKAQQAGLIDILFENIGPVTFALIKARLDAFLENQFLLGVIGSGVPDKSQAFKVICDLTNNTQSTQQAKIIVVDEFIKPNIAAEFIYLRIQKTFDATSVT